MEINKIINGDSRNLKNLISKEIKIQTTITSPPYFDMKDYGVKEQIGFGQEYEEYIEDLKNVFAQVYTLTKEDGTLWIIIDTFKRNNNVITLPFDLVQKLKEIGWLLQEIIIWKKDKTVPWSTNGFMQRKFEYILFFSKQKNYKTNKDTVRVYDTKQLKSWWIKYPERYNPKGKALDEIWEFPIPVQGSWGSKYIRHFCPLPKEMVATMISISTDENDVVFDPFSGSGTVLSQSAYMNRKYLGIELNPKYIEMFNTYLIKTLDNGILEYQKFKNFVNQQEFENTILNLRALKFGRIILNKLKKEYDIPNGKVYIKKHQSDIDQKNQYEYNFIDIKDIIKTEKIINYIISKPPLSKFGINPIITYKKDIDMSTSDNYFYTLTNSHSFLKDIEPNNQKIRIISPIKVDLHEKDYE